MEFGVRALVPQLGLAVAALASFHAASEVGLPGAGVPLPSGMDARATALAVDRGFRTEMSRSDPQDLGQLPPLSDGLLALARTSYASDPLEVPAIRTLALGSVLQEDQGRARKLMRLAAEISKRDVVVNMWLAQDYGRTGEVAPMVASFDHALRTSARARGFAMRPLVNNLADPNSYGPLGELLRQRPEWERDFWDEFVSNPVALQHAVAFFAGSALPYDMLPVYARIQLYANLKKTRHFDALFRLAELDPAVGADGERLAEGQIVDAANGNPLGWTTHSRGTYASRIRSEEGELEIAAQAGSFGLAADRIVRVGEASAISLTTAEPVPQHVELELTARCVEGGSQELGSLTLASGASHGQLIVRPEDCRFASLGLSFTAGAHHSGRPIRVANLALRPF